VFVPLPRVDAFAGPLFMTSLLRDGMLGGIGTAKLTIGDRELTGRSAWKVNEAGDLVIALAATGENTTVLLVRPVAGLPSPGQHRVTARPDTGALRAMDDAALLAHAARFQLYGVATGRRLPTVLTGFEAGDVVLERVDDNVLAGSVSGLVKTLPTQRAGQGEVLAVELAFEAAEGLEDFRFRSPESRFQ